MKPSEEIVDHLEAHVPKLAHAAVTQAYCEALAAGHSVLIAEDGVIYEVFPDGTRKAVKHTEPPVAVAPDETQAMP